MELIPQELKDAPNWLVWRFVEKRPGEFTKEPFDAKRAGQHARSNDSSTWSAYQIAEYAWRNSDLSGVGFVLSPESPYICVDLDHCISEDGQILPWAQEILDRFPSYAEISPSGRGIKIYARSSKEKHAKKSHAFDGKQKVELFTQNQYLCVTGNLFGDYREITDCTDAHAWLLDQYFAPKGPPPPPPTRPSYHYVPDTSGGLSADALAWKYIEKVEPAVSGQRGHDRTMRVACILVQGFGLSVEAARPILKSYSSQCLPPWSEKELEHKLKSADAQPGHQTAQGLMPRGWKYAEYLERMPSNGPDIDISAFVRSLEQPAEVKVEAKADEPKSTKLGNFPLEEIEGIPGLLGEIIDYNLRNAIYPQPELAFAGALSLLSALTGRKVRDSRNLRTNLYILGLARTGTGKEWARDINMRILDAANAAHYLGPEDLASDAAIYSQLEQQPSTLFQLDEVAQFFTMIRSGPYTPSHLGKINSSLLKLYTSSNKPMRCTGYADASRNRIINEPHVVLYGTNNPDGLWAALSKKSLTEGLVGRLLVFEGRGYQIAQKRATIETIPQTIIDAVRWWIDFQPGHVLSSINPQPITVPYSGDASDRMDKHIHEINLRQIDEDPDHAAVWSRSGEKAKKLALLFACSRAHTGEDIVVEIEDVNRAIKINNWVTRKLLHECEEQLADNETESNKKKILRIVGSKQMTMNELTRKTQFLKSRDRQELLNDLAEGGDLIMQQFETGGRPKVMLWRPDRVRTP
ncbi:MAG: DUF3987 domain-containing protein [Hyphomicrobiaceae bacterium]|nr:MAG: DUF3987 domain-containing protein [Hyphomicrobiaceae bacterium]